MENSINRWIPILLLIVLILSMLIYVGCNNRATSDLPCPTEIAQPSIAPEATSMAADNHIVKPNENPQIQMPEIKIITPSGKAGEWYKIPADLADVVKKFIQNKIASPNNESDASFDALVTKKELMNIDIGLFKGKSLSMKMDTSIPEHGTKYTCIEVFNDNNPDGEKIIFLLVQNASIWKIDNVFVGTTVSVNNDEELSNKISSNKLIIASSYFHNFKNGSDISGYKNLIIVMGSWLPGEVTFNNCENTFVYAISFGEDKRTDKVNIKGCENFISYHCTFSGGMLAENSNNVQIIDCWFDCGKTENIFDFKKCNDILVNGLSIQNGDSFWNETIKSIIKLDSCGDIIITNSILDSGFKLIAGTASSIDLSGNRVKEPYMDTSILFGDWDGNGKVQKLILNHIGRSDNLLTFYNEDGETELLQEYLTDTDYMAVEKSFIIDVNGDEKDEVLFPALSKMISLDGSVLNIEPMTDNIIKSDVHEWEIDLDNDGNQESVKETLSVDITKCENILLSLEIMQNDQSKAKRQFELEYEAKNLINPGIVFEDIDQDGLKEILLDNKMIFKPVKANGIWTDLQNIENNITVNANDYINITSTETEKKEVVLEYPCTPDKIETIRVPVPIGIHNTDKLRISGLCGFYTNDIDQDGFKEICVRSYLEIPYKRHRGLQEGEEDSICYYGQIASIDIYVHRNDNNEWSVNQIEITPKYDSSVYDQSYKGDFRGLFNDIQNNPQPYSLSNQLLALSNQVNYYGAGFWVPGYDITTPHLMMKNGLAMGMSKNEVKKIMGIPDAGDILNNQWIYYCAYSAPEYHTMNIYFYNDIIVKIELRAELVID